MASVNDLAASQLQTVYYNLLGIKMLKFVIKSNYFTTFHPSIPI